MLIILLSCLSCRILRIKLCIQPANKYLSMPNPAYDPKWACEYSIFLKERTDIRGGEESFTQSAWTSGVDILRKDRLITRSSLGPCSKYSNKGWETKWWGRFGGQIWTEFFASAIVVTTHRRLHRGGRLARVCRMRGCHGVYGRRRTHRNLKSRRASA